MMSYKKIDKSSRLVSVRENYITRKCFNGAKKVIAETKYIQNREVNIMIGIRDFVMKRHMTDCKPYCRNKFIDNNFIDVIYYDINDDKYFNIYSIHQYSWSELISRMSPEQQSELVDELKNAAKTIESKPVNDTRFESSLIDYSAIELILDEIYNYSCV